MNIYYLILITLSVCAADRPVRLSGIAIPKLTGVTGSELVGASVRGDQLLVRDLLNRGVNINYRDDAGGNTSVMALAERFLQNPQGQYRKDLEAVMYLLATSGADFDIPNNVGQTARTLIEKNRVLKPFKKYLR